MSDAAYADIVKQLLDSAQLSALCTLFIVDLVPDFNSENLVLEIVEELEAAAWRGVDARLLIGGSRTNLEIAAASQLAQDVIARGLPCRWLTARRRRGSHVKAVVVDDWVLLGSHNWTPRALADQKQDSILVASESLAAVLANEFDRQWKRSYDHV